MGTGEILGELEHHVLLVTLRREGEAYTAALVEELEAQTNREVAPSSVYITLKRLERKGFVRSELRTGDAPGQLRERRFFAATEAGVEALRESRERYVRLWDGLDARLAEG